MPPLTKRPPNQLVADVSLTVTPIGLGGTLFIQVADIESSDPDGSLMTLAEPQA